MTETPSQQDARVDQYSQAEEVQKLLTSTNRVESNKLDRIARNTPLETFAHGFMGIGGRESASDEMHELFAIMDNSDLVSKYNVSLITPTSRGVPAGQEHGVTLIVGRYPMTDPMGVAYENAVVLTKKGEQLKEGEEPKRVILLTQPRANEAGKVEGPKAQVFSTEGQGDQSEMVNDAIELYRKLRGTKQRPEQRVTPL